MAWPMLMWTISLIFNFFNFFLNFLFFLSLCVGWINLNGKRPFERYGLAARMLHAFRVPVNLRRVTTIIWVKEGYDDLVPHNYRAWYV